MKIHSDRVEDKKRPRKKRKTYQKNKNHGGNI